MTYTGYTGLVTVGSAEGRLERLIQDRLTQGADKESIDQRIWDLFGEEWAVMFTDLAGFSRQVADFGIIHFLQTIVESQRLFMPVIYQFEGFLLKVEADSLLLIFRSVTKAVECAIEMQRAARDYNVGRLETDQILLCLGIGMGPMLRIGEHDIYGEQVNAASKLGEDTAEAWEVLVTHAVQQGCAAVPGLAFERLEYVPPGAEAAYKVLYQL